mgnify:CR=1 FL=1
MAIITDSIIDVGNYITFNIGLSKAISNYSADEVWNYQYCSSSWDAFRHICDESYQGYAPGSIEASEFQMPFHFLGMNTLYIPTTYNFEEGQIEYNQGENGIYGKIIWLCVTGDTSIAHIFGTQRCITNTDGVKIITQMDMTQVYLFLNTFQDPASNDPMYCNYDNFKIKEDHEGITTYEHPRNCSIFPAVMFKYNDKLYIHRIFQDTYTNLDWSWWLAYYGPDQSPLSHTELQGHTFNAQPVAFTNDANAYLPVNIMRQFSGLRPTSTERFYTASDIEDVGVRYQWLYGYDGGRICPATEAKYLQMASWYGMMFHHNGTYYKPVIEDGYVTGYTDDMSTPSDIDNWTGATNHDVPPGPPGPGGDDDDENTPVNTAGAPYAKGLVNYYAMTAGSVLIDHIADALSTWDLQNTGKDLFKNLVSCKLIKPPAAIPSSGSEPFTIYGEKPQYEGADITLPVVSGNPEATFGPYTIKRKFNDFRDYAPYTRVSIYLPYCGWCDLPSHVVGKKVTVKYFTDIIAATVRAVVFCGNNIVAEAAGVMGLDIPFTADAVGMKQAGVVNGLTAYAGGALQTAAGVASIVTTKGGKGIGETLSGASKLVSAYTQTAMAFNENTTEISGKNGDGCCLAGATNILIKIIRPKYTGSDTAPFVPAGFAHSVGYVSNKQVRVGNVSGLLIADNVDTSGIAGATDAERAEIKRVLETGLIVNAAPE